MTKIDMEERWWITLGDVGISIRLNEGEEYVIDPALYVEVCEMATMSCAHQCAARGEHISDGVLTIRRVYDSTYKCWNLLARWDPNE